jgi:ABC-2 type transport system ATP-binding protein
MMAGSSGSRAVLRFSGFSKTYGFTGGKVPRGGTIPDGTGPGNTKKAVDKLSLTVEAGSVFGFIGHNGAGKTTSLRAAAGIIGFEEGDIFIEGHSVRTEPLLCKSRIAYIPDNPDIYEYLTGVQYLSFIADIYGVGRADRLERIGRYGDLFELKSVLGDLVSSYSHGMKQKLALVSAFLHDPRLLILDEPFAGLDPQAAFHLRGIMRRFCAGGGAVFFSTHALEAAEKLCDTIAIIKEGRLRAQGPIDAVRGDKTLEAVFLEIDG